MSRGESLRRYDWETLTVYLAQNYTVTNSQPPPPTGGLPKSRLGQMLEFIDTNLERDMHLDELAGAASLSPFHFAKLFKQSTGASPHQYLMQRRLERAKDLLKHSGMTLGEISVEAGFLTKAISPMSFEGLWGLPPPGSGLYSDRMQSGLF